MSENEAPKEIGRFHKRQENRSVFDMIREYLPFLRNEKEQRSLVGRIHSQLQQDTHSMHQQLQTLKVTLRKELDNHHDGQLWISFESVINPLLREYRLIERQLSQPTDHSKVQNVNSWIDRATLWVALCSKPTDRESMVQAVVTHTLEVLDRLIDRDLKTLADYKEQELKLLGLGEEAHSVVMQRLTHDLKPYVEDLELLKRKKPKDMQLATLVDWKAHADEQRSHLFNSALQMMDAIINSATPFAPLEEEEHLKELIHRIIYLENELQVLQVQFDNSDLGEALQGEILQDALAFFEKEVHGVHHDLRLTPELLERVQVLIQQFAQLRYRLKNWPEW
jgi:hypothetical protein